MNDSSSSPDPLLDPLFARARMERPDTSRAEYAFETRLLAKLTSASTRSTGGVGSLAWRLVPYFALVVLGLGALQMESDRQSQEAAQAASLQNPDVVDLFATFN
jgi:hypothetical protein